MEVELFFVGNGRLTGEVNILEKWGLAIVNLSGHESFTISTEDCDTQENLVGRYDYPETFVGREIAK